MRTVSGTYALSPLQQCVEHATRLSDALSKLETTDSCKAYAVCDPAMRSRLNDALATLEQFAAREATLPARRTIAWSPPPSQRAGTPRPSLPTPDLGLSFENACEDSLLDSMRSKGPETTSLSTTYGRLRGVPLPGFGRQPYELPSAESPRSSLGKKPESRQTMARARATVPAVSVAPPVAPRVTREEVASGKVDGLIRCSLSSVHTREASPSPLPPPRTTAGARPRNASPYRRGRSPSEGAVASSPPPNHHFCLDTLRSARAASGCSVQQSPPESRARTPVAHRRSVRSTQSPMGRSPSAMHQVHPVGHMSSPRASGSVSFRCLSYGGSLYR